MSILRLVLKNISFQSGDKMIVKKLDYEAYKGQKYQAEIVSDRFLSIEPAGEGFDIRWVMSDELLRMSVNDVMLEDWLDMQHYIFDRLLYQLDFEYHVQ